MGVMFQSAFADSHSTFVLRSYVLFLFCLHLCIFIARNLLINCILILSKYQKAIYRMARFELNLKPACCFKEICDHLLGTEPDRAPESAVSFQRRCRTGPVSQMGTAAVGVACPEFGSGCFLQELVDTQSAGFETLLSLVAAALRQICNIL